MIISLPKMNNKTKTHRSRIKICSWNSPIKSFESRFVPSFDAKILESSRCPFCAARWSGTCAWVFFPFKSISGLSRSCFTIYIQMNTNIITVLKWKNVILFYEFCGYLDTINSPRFGHFELQDVMPYLHVNLWNSHRFSWPSKVSPSLLSNHFVLPNE